MERTQVLRLLMSRSRFLIKQYSEFATGRGVGREVRRFGVLFKN